MKSMPTQRVQNLIIGAGLVGSITGWILAERGHSGVLLDRSSDAGGVNGSFLDALGNRFDHGRHVINADRDAFTSQFFTDVQNGNVRRFTLRRGIVLCGHVIPYAAPLADWPEALRERIELDVAAGPVRLGSTREQFARVYGRWFADLAFDEMLSAYPTLVWQREHGVPEERLMRWIFPWFFPRTKAEGEPAPGKEQGVYSQESRDYHYSARHSNPPREEVLYPREGGFGNWIECMLAGVRERMEVLLGAVDVSFDFDPKTLALRSVTAGGRRYVPERVFWCAPLPVLCKILGWPLPGGHPQGELLGNFAFRDPVDAGYHEILFADPRHLIRRVTLPEVIAGAARSRTLQVEFTTPEGMYSFAEGEWLERWHASLIELGIVSSDNPLLNAELRRVSRGIVTTADLGEFVTGCRARLEASGTNLIAPHLAAASDNNSRLVPEVHRRVTEALAGSGISGR